MGNTKKMRQFKKTYVHVFKDMCVKKKQYNNIENSKNSWHNIWHSGIKQENDRIYEYCKIVKGDWYPMFTSLKQPNRYTKCTKKTLIKQTLCVDCAAWAPTSKPAYFWTFFFWLDIESTVCHKKPTVCIFAEEKIHNLPVESDQSLKVHCLWEWFFIKRWSISLFFPSHGNLFLRLSKVSWKKFLSFSLELFILYRGTCEFSWAQEAILCPLAAGSQGLCLSVFVWI